MLAAVGAVPGHTGMPPQGAAGPPQMAGVAKLLGLSATELSEQLRSGKTMSALASEKGVSGAELVKTIETELAANRPEGVPALSGAALTQLATGIANGTPPQPPAGGGHGSGGPATLAQSLGVDPSVLLEQLEKGSSLSSLLEEGGYTSQGAAQEAASHTGVVFDSWA